MQTKLKQMLGLVLACMVVLGSVGLVTAAEPPTPTASEPEQVTPLPPPEESVPPDSAEDITPSTGLPEEPTAPSVTEPATEGTEETFTEPVPSEESTVPSVPNPEPAPTEPDSSVAAPEADSQDIPDGPTADEPELLGGRPFTNLGMYQIMARSKVYLDPYDTGKYLSSINRMYFTGPTEYAYCIQPGTPTAGSYLENSNVNPWTRLSADQRKAMGVVLALGFPKTYHHDGFPSSLGRAPSMGDSLSQWQTSEYYAATQIIIWEILRGERSATPPYTRTSSATLDKFYGFHSPDWYGLLAEYKALDKLLSNYGVAPSFASSSPSNAPTHEMHFDESKKTYQLTLTDSNHVLTLLTPASENAQEMRHFEFQASGMTIHRSGNTLTITAPESMGDQLAAGVLVKSNGSTADSSGNCIVWSNGSKQVLISSAGGSAEFPPAYFKLHATPIQRNGFLEIHKIDATNGKNLIGAVFQAVSTNGTEYQIGPTNDQGYAVSAALPLGTYTITETIAPNGYQINSSIPEVIVGPDNTTPETAYQLTVKDQPNTVPLNIRKTTNTGENLDGWKFNIYSDAGCNNLVAGDLESGPDGTISTYLNPGTYWVKEVGDTQGRWGSPFWVCDTHTEQITLTAGKTGTVAFSNTQRPGKISIHKVDPSNQPLAGATFLLEWSKDGAAWTPVHKNTESYVVTGGCTSEELTADGCLKTGPSGDIAFTGLHPDLLYRLTEVEAPDTYTLLAAPIEVGKLTPDQSFEVSFTVVNRPVLLLPATGGSGLTRMGLGLGAALALCGGALILLRKRRG